MAGFQMFVAKMDDELLQLWDASCDTPFARQAIYKKKQGVINPSEPLSKVRP